MKNVREFLDKYFDNSDNVLFLVEDLDLVPSNLITDSVLLSWKIRFKVEYINECRKGKIPEFDQEFTEAYLKDLQFRFQTLNHSRQKPESDSLFTVKQLNLF